MHAALSLERLEKKKPAIFFSKAQFEQAAEAIWLMGLWNWKYI